MAASKFADGKLTDQGAIDLIKQQLAAFDKFIERVKVLSQQEHKGATPCMRS